MTGKEAGGNMSKIKLSTVLDKEAESCLDETFCLVHYFSKKVKGILSSDHLITSDKSTDDECISLLGVFQSFV